MTARKKTPLAGKVKVLREKKGMTQQDLAQAADLSMSIVSQIEQGKRPDPRVSTLRGIASALGVSMDELMKG
jgi:transcriptional regulator with XRE-family HTH domain